MANFRRNAPPIAVVLASLILWVSFAWGLPAEPPAAGGEADVAPKDPWAGVRVSDAYDYAKCPECGKKDEIRAESCSRCGNELLQPTARLAYPPWVFVPGRGYNREGTLLEPGKSRKGLWITGLVLAASGAAVGGAAFAIAAVEESGPGALIVVMGAAIVTGVGVVLLIVGLSTRKEPVYAFASDEGYEPYDSASYARRTPDSDGAAFKVEVTVLGF
jgi:predicted RNA-binding Zn-ribbon protein involved in translation (DUF1610 family)